MNKKNLCLVALLAIAAMPQSAEAAKKTKDPVVMTIAGKAVTRSEFEYFYNKNNDVEGAEEKTFDEYVELFVNYKLKVAEAYAQGVDTTQAYRDELATYRDQIAEPYLQIQGWADTLLQQVQDRRQWEVRASHLLLSCDEQATQAQSDSLYQVVLGYQRQVEAGASFDSLARMHSQDPSARQNAGDLGYFSTLQMVYPFEQAAFNTPVGQTSVVRSRFGWHLVKVVDRRRSEGEVLVAHIMKNMGNNPKPAIDSIYQALQGGADWDALCASTSDDQYTASNGGAYPWLSRAARFPQEWLDQCYALEVGHYSEPFATQFGWHIVRLLDRREAAPFDSAQEARLKEQLARDPERMAAGRQAFLAQCRARLAQDKKLARQAAQWNDSLVMAWANRQLEEQDPEFRNVYREYHDGLMLFDVSSRAVWDKATQDSVGLARFFDSNRQKYAFEQPRFKGAFIECVDDDALYDALRNIYDHHDALEAANEVRNTILTDTLLTPNPRAPRFHIVNGLFSRGDNSCVDAERLHVEGATFIPREQMPRYMTYGRVLTEPDGLDDVRGTVVADYQTQLEEVWVAELRQKYAVKINQKELDKIRK